jgi:hypothetical protein
MIAASFVRGGHAERVEFRRLGLGQAFHQAVFLVMVHQKADRALVHAVDGNAALHIAVQGLQHEPVAAQGDDDVGLVGRHMVVTGGETFSRFLRLFLARGDEGHRLEIHGFLAASSATLPFFPTTTGPLG